MITLERVRLVNWHNFDEVTINIGNRCLISGDNGSGKSTIIDAIQYAMAADLRKARFNAAAGDRKGGRDLPGYVRCKLGSDTTEYLRGDTAAHVMLEFSSTKPSVTEAADVKAPAGFSAGVCVEAYTDGRLSEHFWIGGDIPVDSVTVNGGNGDGAPLNFRQFKDILEARGGGVYESKKMYLRDFTARLGVWRRFADYNPYLESFTRSISFTPLVSVDNFVCDYILEDRPVEITTMKENLESYKEAERQAEGAVKRIESLRKITAAAAEWRRLEGLIVKQEYLKLKIELALALEKQAELNRELARAEESYAFFNREVSAREKQKFDLYAEREDIIASLAANDAHNLYRRIEERIGRLKIELPEAEAKKESYSLRRSQCEALLGHALSGDTDADIAEAEAEESRFRALKDEAARRKEKAASELRDVLSELNDLKRGKVRYPDYTETLRERLRQDGISAIVLADAVEVIDPVWTDAVEGWLNTRRFALLVEPELFQQALEVYDGLPRSVAGALLPNLGKMRGAAVKNNSLASLVKSSSVYARIYVDFVLGDVVCADIQNLRKFNMAVTKECMTYHGHTASRIKEEVYGRRYLGQSARRERGASLAAEAERLRGEAAEAGAGEAEASRGEELFRRAVRGIAELAYLLPALEACQRISAALAGAEKELAAVDKSGFLELEERQAMLTCQISKAETDLKDLIEKQGRCGANIETLKGEIEDTTRALDENEDAIRVFSESHILEMEDCENSAKEKIAVSGIAALSSSYETTLKTFRTQAENQRKTYRNLAHNHDRDFSGLLSLEPEESGAAELDLRRLETSELPEYREKIAAARRDAEREFKEHFISKLNEFIEEAHESFREINDILKSLSFGRDQYRFTLEERNDKRADIEVIRAASEIPVMEDGLFNQINDPKELKAARELFDNILNAELDSQKLREICDYRKYFTYDIKITHTDLHDQKSGNAVVLSLSKVLREKSGGETQTPYYVAIAASFYRFYKARPESTVRLVMFDEAFNRMDDERIGKVLAFFREINLQILSAVPTEKIEATAAHMDRINIVIRYGNHARVRDFYAQRDAINSE
ncbi:MAG: hypothetical protein LBO04_02065 [Spirochaetaceae bacterium]|jgi:uncharacterized protein YPO0396|nr:hypothetical protein [Spirochaetaceae bacterium]